MDILQAKDNYKSLAMVSDNSSSILKQLPLPPHQIPTFNSYPSNMNLMAFFYYSILSSFAAHNLKANSLTTASK
jgi:hypothetical protein